MVLTPNFQPRPTRNLSARAQDLNNRLDETIDTFRRQFPDTTDSDIRNALLSASGSRAGGAPRAATILAATLGGLVMAGVAVLVMNGGPPADVEVPWVAVAGAAAAIVVVAARLFNRP